MTNAFSATRLSLFVLFCGIGLAALIGSSARPDLLQVSAVAFISGLLTLKPNSGLYLALAFEFFYLVFVLIGVEPNVVGIGVFGYLVLEASVKTLKPSSIGDRPQAALLWLPLLLLWGVAIGLARFQSFDVLNALRIFVFPLVAYSLIRDLTRRQLTFLLNFIGFALLLNAGAAIWETVVGPEALMQLGLTYGTEIREIGSVLRAPGLMRGNAYLGLTASFFFLGLVLFRSHLDLSRRLQNLFLVACSVAMLLSTARTGLVVLAGGVLLQRLNLKSTARNLLLTIAMVVSFSVFGAGSGDSGIARLTVWSRALATVDFTGGGFGSMGSTTYSDFSGTKGAFSDNYYISLVQQFGILGFAICVAAIVYAVRLRRAPGPSGQLWAPVFGAFLLSCLVIDAWEYWPAMAVMLSWFRLTQIIENEVASADFDAAPFISSTRRR